MNTDQLYAQIKAKGSMLCVGLDTDYSKLPEKIRLECQRGDLALQGRFYSGKARAIISFNKAIIDATAPYCVAYKPNLAFYEAFGSEGLSALEGTVS
ncbi:MAG: hypothetical protein II142_01610, partial [Bacteroidales bacterium]|nr:hypothetical protein [Bacteroidales bacterium]